MTGNIRLFGPRRSGTNATAHYIEHYLNQHVILNGRHGDPASVMRHADPIPNFTGYAVTTKNPYAWLASITRWVRLDDVAGFEDWARLDHQLLECWALKHKVLMDWMQQPSVSPHVQVFQAEAWATPDGGRAMLADAAATWGLELREEYNGPTSRHQSQGDKNAPPRFDPAYYTQHKYLDDLDGRITNVKHLLQREWVRDIMEPWGYSAEVPC